MNSHRSRINLAMASAKRQDLQEKIEKLFEKCELARENINKIATEVNTFPTILSDVKQIHFKEQYLKLMYNLTERIFIIDEFNININNTGSFELENAGCPQSTSPQPSTVTDVYKDVNLPQQPPLNSGYAYSGLIMNIDVPAIWIVLNPLCELLKLRRQMREFYNNINNMRDGANLICEPMTYCAIFDDDTEYWYRALFLKTTDDSKADLYFVDTGEERTVALQQIRPLHPQFAALPPSARCCHLVDVEYDDTDKELTAKVQMFLQQFIGKMVTVGIVDNRSESLAVTLQFEDGTNIHDKFIEAGFSHGKCTTANSAQPASSIANIQKENEEKDVNEQTADKRNDEEERAVNERTADEEERDVFEQTGYYKRNDEEERDVFEQTADKRNDEEERDVLEQIGDYKRNDEEERDVFEQTEDYKRNDEEERDVLEQIGDYKRNDEEERDVFEQTEDYKRNDKEERDVLEQIGDYKRNDEEERDVFEQTEDYKRNDEEERDVLEQIGDYKRNDEEERDVFEQTEDYKRNDKEERDVLEQIGDYKRNDEEERDVFEQTADKRNDEEERDVLEQIGDYKRNDEEERDVFEQTEDYKRNDKEERAVNERTADKRNDEEGRDVLEQIGDYKRNDEEERDVFEQTADKRNDEEEKDVNEQMEEVDESPEIDDEDESSEMDDEEESPVMDDEEESPVMDDDEESPVMDDEDESPEMDDVLQAVTGYHNHDEEEICKFFVKGSSKCFKKICNKKHIPFHPDGWTLDKVPCAAINEAMPLPAPGTWHYAVVTAVPHFNRLYVHFRDEKQIDFDNLHLLSPEPEKLRELIISMNGPVSSEDAMPFAPAIGEVVAAKFEDGFWYRARVLSVSRSHGTVEVIYLDYGNRKTVNEEDLRELSPAFRNLPGQAILCKIYGLELRSYEPQLYAQAREFVQSLINNKLIQIKVISRDYDEMEVIVCDKKGFIISEMIALNLPNVIALPLRAEDLEDDPNIYMYEP